MNTAIQKSGYSQVKVSNAHEAIRSYMHYNAKGCITKQTTKGLKKKEAELTLESKIIDKQPSRLRSFAN